MKVRTRFAPSPTGYMHVGNLRTALYAYLWAKKNKGTFILRIEDTDQERIVEGAVELIYRTLEETGLIWDEGPDKGGNYGPYIQHERKPIYKKYAEELIEKGMAYYCFCDKDRLEELRVSLQLRKLPFRYDGRCRKLSKEQVREKLAAGIPCVVRQGIPTMGATTFEDEVFGSITVENATLDDQVLVKSDGMPTYNFANVVDDHLMKITHVIRGNEYLSSTPKYNLLYQAFGWEIPHYVHCSQVMRDAQHKLSKRDGDASYADFIEKGYLKEAIVNYIALLGWNPGTEREKFTLEELVEAFDLTGISRSPAIFDIHKLTWLNGQFIREMPLERFHEIALPWILKAVKREDVDLVKVSGVLHERTEKLSDIPGQLDFIDALPDYSPELYVSKKMKTDGKISLESLNAILPLLEALPAWNHTALHREIFSLIEKRGVKSGVILWPLRTALSGKQFTPGGGVELADIFGREESLRRIRIGIALLEKTVS
ncbi:MAG TPA: glutamate--tRNA ligase [Syntrophales bacterium]|nr:glutamate--tRNA ligase [Syntrophales bacterium]